MTYARVITSGGVQTIELPADVRFDTDEVEVQRRGDDVLLIPKPSAVGKLDVSEVVRLLQELPDEVFEAIEESRRQDRSRNP